MHVSAWRPGNRGRHAFSTVTFSLKTYSPLHASLIFLALAWVLLAGAGLGRAIAVRFGAGRAHDSQPARISPVACPFLGIAAILIGAADTHTLRLQLSGLMRAAPSNSCRMQPDFLQEQKKHAIHSK